MVAKKSFLVTLCAFVCLTGFAQSNIPLNTDPPVGGGKTQTIPTATLDGTILTIDFSEATASQVVIRSQVSNQIVYSDSFSSSTQVQIDLEEENVGEGSYVLWLYAFGKWWRGEFVIEEE